MSELHLEDKLKAAISSNKLDEVKQLLEYHNPTQRTVNEALCLACRRQGKASLELLLDAGADIDYKESDGGTPLLTALEHHNTAGAVFLLDRGASVQTVDGKPTPLMLAALCEDDCCLKRLLLLDGWDLEAKDENGETPLMYACGRNSNMKMLLEKGADANVTDSEGETPLMISGRHKNTVGLKLLLDFGADLEAKTIRGKTALIIALEHYSYREANILLERGACIGVVYKNKTPLTMAFERCDHFPDCLSEATDIILKLLDKRADHYLSKEDQKYLNKMIIIRFNNVVQKLVANGWTPAIYPLDKNEKYPRESLSLFEAALVFNNVGAARYFLANRFLTYRDITELPRSPSTQALLHVKPIGVYYDDSLLDTDEFGERDFYGDGDFEQRITWEYRPTEKRNKIIRAISSSPFSLFTITFVTISSILGQNTQRSQDIRVALPLEDSGGKIRAWPITTMHKETNILEGLLDMNRTVSVSQTSAAVHTEAQRETVGTDRSCSSSTHSHNCVTAKAESSAKPLVPQKMSRSEKVNLLPLPQAMKEMLIFQTRVALTDPQLWRNLHYENV